MDDMNLNQIFNFGPIGRTAASNVNDTFNLASLPLHVMLDALMAATNRDEFVEWLWHDLFKPVFYFPNPTSWYHVPGVGVFQQGWKSFTEVTDTLGERVLTHHPELRIPGAKFTISENAVMSDQVEQVNLGKDARFIQLTFASEPALATALVRAVIADAFIGAVTRSVARALKQVLDTKSPSFNQVHFRFETVAGLTFSHPPTENEIWRQVGQSFDVRPSDNELLLQHVTPVANSANLNYATEVRVDLTGSVPRPEKLLANTLSLAELLVIYQDSRTIILTIPQPQIFPLNLSVLREFIYRAARWKLAAFDAIVVDKDGTDYLKTAFDEQIEIREVPKGPLYKLPGQKRETRPFDPILARSTELLTQATTSGRVCRLCGSPFNSKLAPAPEKLTELFSVDFTDAEYVGQTADVCALCRLYALNSPGATKGKGIRKVLRGAFALVMPSSHFGQQEMTAIPVERPLLDVGGRFAGVLNRVTITTQEFTLFQQMARRIVTQLWREIEPDAPLSLPYLGAILLTHREEQEPYYKIRRLLPKFRNLFKEVRLQAYPFEVLVAPAVEVALDVAVGDDKHARKHTYLKARPSTLPIHPRSRLFALLNNSLQVELSADLFAAVDNLQNLTKGLRSQRRTYWLTQALAGNDPLTAIYEATKASTKLRPVENVAFKQVEKYWRTLSKPPHDPTQLWLVYEQTRSMVANILNQYPFLVNLFSTLQEESDG